MCFDKKLNFLQHIKEKTRVKKRNNGTGGIQKLKQVFPRHYLILIYISDLVLITVI